MGHVTLCVLRKQALGVYPEQIGVKGYSFQYDEAILRKYVDQDYMRCLSHMQELTS